MGNGPRMNRNDLDYSPYPSLRRGLDIFEHAHHFLHATGGAGDFHRRLGFLARDPSQQVDHAAFGHHLDLVGRNNAAAIDEARFDLGSEVAVVAAGGIRTHPGDLDLVDHAAHVADLAHDFLYLRLGGGVGRLAGEQHVAVEAGDVDMHPVAKAVVDTAFSAQVDFLVLGLRADRTPVFQGERRDAGPADHQRQATLQLWRESEQSNERQSAKRRKNVFQSGHDSAPSNNVSMPSHRQCSVSRCTSWMREVRSEGTQICTSSLASRLPILPPLLPVSATTCISRSCAAWIAAMTFFELPLVEIASSTSLACPSACTCRANTCS